jgi:hypothetical protein
MLVMVEDVIGREEEEKRVQVNIKCWLIGHVERHADVP